MPAFLIPLLLPALTAVAILAGDTERAACLAYVSTQPAYATTRTDDDGTRVTQPGQWAQMTECLAY